jgi:DNA-binding CsgD family transcriptional regulator
MGSIHPQGRAPCDRIVRDIYGSLAGDGDFEACLGHLGRAFAAHVCAMHDEDMLSHRATLLIHGAMPAEEMARLNADYARRWGGQNLWMERSVPGFLGKGFEYGEAVVSDAELLGSAYYHHFLEPMDIRHGVGICLWHSNDLRFSVLSLNRSGVPGAFSPEEIALIARLRPHLVTAYDIHRRVAGLEHTNDTLRAGFDSLPMGMLVLAADGRVLEANAEADRLLADHRGVARAADGHLRLCRGPAQARLAAALLRMATTDAPAPESLLLSHAPDSVASALVLHLCALPAGQTPLRSPHGRVIAFLYELTQQSADAIALRVLQTVLALTAMEARVVLALRADGDCALAAGHLGIATSTVRSHLKHAFRKTGTSRQSELVRLAERLVSTLPH